MTTAAGAVPVPAVVPEAAIRWIVTNCSSNVELAALSNVDRRWRRIVGAAILDEAVGVGVGVVDDDDDDGSGSGSGSGSNPQQQQGQHRPQPPLLLLPSMIRRLVQEEEEELSLLEHQDEEPSIARPSSRATTTATQQQQQQEETFCAAWFHPDGIRKIAVSLRQTGANGGGSAESDECGSSHSPLLSSRCSSAEPFAPSGGNSEFVLYEEEGSESEKWSRSSAHHRQRFRRQQQQQQQQQQVTSNSVPRSRSPASLKNTAASLQRTSAATTIVVVGVKDIRNSSGGGDAKERNVALCSNEWRGFRHPIDVLRPFGYAPSFVRDILQEALDRLRRRGRRKSSSSINGDNGDKGDTCTSPSSSCSLEEELRKIPVHRPNFAVRGATVARPESYCLCLDDGEDSDANLETKLREATNGQTSEWVDIRLQEYKQSVTRRNRRRRELQRDVLPRVLVREERPATDPPASTQTQHIGRRQNSVQFLNSNGSHAVCMTTPFFGCGPLAEPVTVFCVGIATEDGCLLSGLFRRFELGHLYPDSSTAEATEQSAVCIATELLGDEQGAAASASASSGADGRRSSFESLPYKFSSDDSSFESSSSGDRASSDIKCGCVFKGVSDKMDLICEDDTGCGQHHEDDDFSSGNKRYSKMRIHRGRMGPGSWHCYTAIFDGPRSEIRIDGVAEPTTCSAADALDEGNNNGSPKAMLDGLTIGSDHCFGMSLCSGFGSGGGEGEGAIAELAAFGGRLALADIESMEHQMMERHNVPPVETAECGDRLWHEYQYAREAQHLYGGEASSCGGVPLRYMARHRLVAWTQQKNPVSGEEILITKIGCQPGAESSDWDD